MSEELHKCSNCEEEYDKSFKFCPYCGQKSDDDLTLGVLFYNTISNYFSFDARFFRSFVPLMIKPGFLPKKFIAGKRLTYIHPAQMYLFITIIFFFLFSFNVRESRASIDKAMREDMVKKQALFQNDSISQEDSTKANVIIDSVMQGLKDNKELMGITGEEVKELDSIVKTNAPSLEKPNFNTGFNLNERAVDSIIHSGASDDEIMKFMGMSEDAGYLERKFYSQMLKFYKEKGLGAIYQTFIDSIPISLFFLLPIFGFLLKIFFYGKGRYAHHLVFSFYYFCFLFMVLSIDLIANMIVEIPDFLDWLLALSTFFYFLIAIKKYYENGWFLSFIKSSMVSFVFLIIILPIAAGIVGLFAFMYY